MSDTDDAVRVGFGTAVADGEGRRLGSLRIVDEHGFSVSLDAGIQVLSTEHLVAGLSSEASVLWGSRDGGVMKQTGDGPGRCPVSGAVREPLFYSQGA